MMRKQEVSFGVRINNGVVKEVGKSHVYVPVNRFAGGTIKWYEDKIKMGKDV